MGKYAENTTVPVAKSRAEIEATLARYGAQAFRYGWDATKAVIEFSAQDRAVRFVLPLPDKNGQEFAWKLRYKLREKCSPEEQEKRYEQACRQKWRALALAIKAKLEAVDAKISLFEQEFLANIVDPSTGKTVYEAICTQLQVSYESSDPQPLLLEGPRS